MNPFLCPSQPHRVVWLREQTLNNPKNKHPMSKSHLKPGQSVPTSGQYGVFGPRGGYLHQEVTGVRGKTLPPTPKPGQTYKLVDRTR